MKKYKVLVEGVNFLIEIDSELIRHGFYTWRCVEALDPAKAESITMEMLRGELKGVVKNEKSDSPMMFVEKIQEADSFDDMPLQRTGFIWYPDERADN